MYVSSSDVRLLEARCFIVDIFQLYNHSRMVNVVFGALVDPIVIGHLYM